MYFDIIYLVIFFIEFWHSRVWGQFIKATGGNNVYNQSGKLLIAGNIICYKFKDNIVDSRIYFINKNYVNNTPKRYIKIVNIVF